MADHEIARHFLSTIWSDLGGDATLADRVTIGGDAVLPSNFAMTDLGGGAFAAAGAAIAELVATSGVPMPAVHADRTLATAWFRGASRRVGTWGRTGGGGPFRDISTDYETRDGRWIRFQANYEHLRDAILVSLDAREDRDEIAAIIKERDADEVEQTIIDGGGAASASHTIEDWAKTPQGAAVTSEPLIDVTATETVTEKWHSTPERPLAGIRILDMTRVLAGPMGTRLLAGYGAEVLRLDPPGYFEPGGGSGGDLTIGKRAAYLDLKTPAGRDTFLELLAGADVFVHGLRADALDRLGLSSDVIAEARPGLVEVVLNAYGWSGPWVNRRGFDTIVQLSTGMAIEGMKWAGTDRPLRWPLSILDHATGYMIAAAAIRGLTRRVTTGEGSLSRLALARTAASIVAVGNVPEEQAIEHPLPGPYEERVYTTATAPVQRLEWPLKIDNAFCYWERAGDPYGSSTAMWATAGSALAGAE